MIFTLGGFLVAGLTNVLTMIVRSVLWFSFIFSVAYSLGWVQRLLWLVLEQTASTLWNGTPVTIGTLEIDLIRGRVWATNVVIHTPKREEWGWESPLICRIGRVYVEHNWITSFLTMCVRMACGFGQKQILEIYTVELSDVQGFIERKQHIFNFYLMDQWLDLPDPKELEEEKDTRKNQSGDSRHLQQQDALSNTTANDLPKTNRQIQHDNQSEASVDLSIDQDQVEAAYAPLTTVGTSTDREESLLDDEGEDEIGHRQAQQLVDDMLTAVKTIGRAARRRGSLVGAFVEQRAQLASKLKEFKGTKNKTEAMQEGVKVIQRVGKAVAKKTKTLQTAIPKMPKRREPDIAPVYGRVGRVVIEDARVFTRTSTSSGSTGAASTATDSTAGTSLSGSVADSTVHAQHSLGEHLEANSFSIRGHASKWNKPIGISEMVLHSSELCPPNSLLDENGLPEIYQPLDNIADVVMKRALVGLAKNNTTRFLQTALGELLGMEYSTIFGETDFANTDAGSPSPPPSVSKSPRNFRRSVSGGML